MLCDEVLYTFRVAAARLGNTQLEGTQDLVPELGFISSHMASANASNLPIVEHVCESL